MSNQPSIQVRPKSGISATREMSFSDLMDMAYGTGFAPNVARGINNWGPVNPLVTDGDGSTITFNLDRAPVHIVVLGGSRILALANVSVGQVFTILLQQGGSGSNTVTWFSTIRWNAATPPTLTTSVGQIDAFTFLCIAPASYLNLYQNLNL